MAVIKVQGFGSTKPTPLEWNWKHGIGDIVELSKPRYYKRFVWLSDSEIGDGKIAEFTYWLHGIMRLPDVRVRLVAKHGNYSIDSLSDIHYALPKDQARMTLELVAYFTGEPK